MEIKDQAAELAIKIFRTQSVARLTWASFHMIFLDGSFLPPQTPKNILKAAIAGVGIAGIIAFDKISETECERVVISWAETGRAYRALAVAADVLDPQIGVDESAARVALRKAFDTILEAQGPKDSTGTGVQSGDGGGQPPQPVDIAARTEALRRELGV